MFIMLKKDFCEIFFSFEGEGVTSVYNYFLVTLYC